MRLRAPVQDDAVAVLDVLIARDTADIGVPDYTLGDLRDEWRASDFDLSTDAVVGELEDGRVVAYAAARRLGVLAVIAPDQEGRGLGARLLQWAERREREQGRDRHRQWVAATNSRGQMLLRAAGYSCSRSYWRMVRRLDDVAERDLGSVGFNVRSLDVDRDAAALHELDAASFAANPDYEPESFAAFREEHLRAHDLDPNSAVLPSTAMRSLGSSWPAARSTRQPVTWTSSPSTPTINIAVSGPRCCAQHSRASPLRDFEKPSSALLPTTRER